MTDRELMQQALDALDLLARYENPATKVQVRKPRDGGPIVTMYPHKVATEAAVPLRARLAQPEPEPHGYLWFTRHMEQRFTHRKPKEDERIGDVTPVFAAPQKLEWQSLTDEDIKTRWDDHIIPVFNKNGINPFVFARAIEAKLKEKNT